MVTMKRTHKYFFYSIFSDVPLCFYHITMTKFDVSDHTAVMLQCHRVEERLHPLAVLRTEGGA